LQTWLGSDIAVSLAQARPVATAPMRPLAWEPPYAAGAALEKTEKKKKKELDQSEDLGCGKRL